MSKKLFIGMCIGLLLAAALAQAHHIIIYKEQLPYSDAKTLNVSGSAGEVMSIYYGAWLSGPGQLAFNNSPEQNGSSEHNTYEQIDIFIAVPSSASEGNYSSNISFISNTTNESVEFFFEILNHTAAEEEAELHVSLNKNSFRLGEIPRLTINAADGSDVSIEVCKQGTGFVPCFYPDVPVEANYPLQLTLNQANLSGNYTLTATMSHNSKISSAELKYFVENTLRVDVIGTTKVKEGEQINLTAECAGGIGSCTYKWKLPDNSVKTGKSLITKFSQEGTYTIQLTLNDEYENELTKAIPVQVYKAYPVVVTVKDKRTGSAISNAVVSIGDENKDTDNSGKATFYLGKGTYDVFILKEGYDFIVDEKTVNGELSLEYFLIAKDEQAPQITLISPKNSTQLSNTEVELKFKAVDDSEANCELYLNDGRDSFFTLEKTFQVLNADEQKATLELDYGTYFWRVECEDQSKNSGVSETWSFELTETAALAAAPPAQELAGRGNLLEAIYDAQETLSRFNTEQKAVAEALRLENALSQGIKTIERAARDLNDLDRRTLISSEEKKQRADEINAGVMALYSELAANVQVLGTKKYVKYIREDELEPLLSDFYADSGQKVNKGLVNYVKGLQNSITVSTAIFNVAVTYLDGTKKEITLIVLDVAYEDLSSLDGQREGLVLAIPKELASLNDITSVIPYEKANEAGANNYLHYKLEDRVTVYFGRKPLEQAETNNLLLMKSRLPADLSLATGRAVLDFGSTLNTQNLLLIIILVLIPIYFMYAFDGLSKLQGLYVRFAMKEARSIMLLADDAHAALAEKDIDSALNSYQEIQQQYAALSIPAKKKVHSNISALCRKIDVAAADVMIEQIYGLLESGDLNAAMENYYSLQESYDKISTEFKAEIYFKIMNLAKEINRSK